MKLLILYLLWGYFLYSYIKARRTNKAECERHIAFTHDVLMSTVKETLGEQAVERLKGNKIWMGMPTPLLCYVMGEPSHYDEIRNPGKIYWTYYYNEIPGHRKNAARKYYNIVWLENGIVTHWDFMK